MQINFVSETGVVDAAGLVLFEGESLAAPFAGWAAASAGRLDAALKAARFSGRAGQKVELLAIAEGAPTRLLFAGAGARGPGADLAVERAAATLYAAVQTSGADSLVIALAASSPSAAARAALGVALAAYRFDTYRTTLPDEKRPSITEVRILTDDPDAARAAYARWAPVADGVGFARDLVNAPANALLPADFARKCQGLTALGLEVEVLDEAAMRALGMHSLLGVGQGSAAPSQLVVMQWRGDPDRAAPPIAFVGKGVCFDSGGLNIKTPFEMMVDMKGDMGGAAAVAGALHALAGRKAPINAVGVLGLVENMPSGTAQRPGDIVRSMSGLTIEILNTDAEGRLVLADALWYAQTRFKPRAMVDVATLTGAIVLTFANEYAGLFANDDALAASIATAGMETDELVWRLPMAPAYEKLLETPNADIKNIGGRNAGSITAAQFLQRFTGGAAWAHLDIASTAWKAKHDDPRQPVWGGGWGVRLLDRLADAAPPTAAG